jgi:hypothetical protein
VNKAAVKTFLTVLLFVVIFASPEIAGAMHTVIDALHQIGAGASSFVSSLTEN